jgi:hypothetical protein
MNLNWISVLFLAVMAGLSGVAKADSVVVQTACTWHETDSFGWKIVDTPTGCMRAAANIKIELYDFTTRLQFASPPGCQTVGGEQIGDKIMLNTDTHWRTFTVVRQCKVKTP